MKRFVRHRKITLSIVLMVMSFCFIAPKARSNVSISEIMFGSERRFTPPQWIELHNSGAGLVNLNGWKLTIQNRNSPDLTGPVNATIIFEDDFWGDAPNIWPNATILVVSNAEDENSGNVAEEEVYDLRWRQELGLGLWDTVLSAEGFYLELTDSNGNLVDTAGNFDGNALQWQLPLGPNKGRNRAGHRVSMIRRYTNGLPLDGTLVTSWVSAENANLAPDQQTYYGDANDISSPGVGPMDVPTVPVDLPTVPTVDVPTVPTVDLPVVDCQVGAILVPGQSCTYPGTDAKFSILDNGDGQFLNLIFASLNFRNTNIGDQSYTLVANKRNDGSWTIEEVGDIQPPPADLPTVDCQVGAILAPGQSCTYPGTDAKFSILDNGDGQFLNLTFASLNFRNTNIGDRSYTLVANKRNDGSWTIEEVGTEKPPPVDLPVVDCQVGAILAPGQSCTYPGTDIKFSILDNGDGQFLSFTGSKFNLKNTNVNGQPYTLVADKRNDGSWKIAEIGIVEESAAVNPRGRKWLMWGQLKANRK